MLSDLAPLPHPPEWAVRRLKDVCLKIGSGATPPGGQLAYLSQRERFALIRSQNVFDRTFDDSGLAFISDAQAAQLKGATVRPGDLLLNITGDGVTFSRCCAAPKEVLPACVNQHVPIVRVDPETADPGYVLSFLTHPAVKVYVESFNAGGSRRAITKGHIESFQIPLPPLPEQRAIAGVLGALDDKIELNRRMNETLEEIARALFKSWFVEFDPVRAKSEGRQPWGMDAQTAALFPSEFEDSELGEIPKGWRVSTVGDVATLERAGVNPASAPDEVFEHFSLPAFDAGRRPARELGAAIKSNKLRVPKEAVLVSKLNPHIPRVWYPAPTEDTRAVASTEFLVTLPRRAGWRNWLYLWATSDTFKQRFGSLVTGTTGSHQRVTPDAFVDMKLVEPHEPLVAAIDAIVNPMLQRVLANLHESDTLAELRDTLLPKLMSGEVRVRDAERTVEAVG